MKLFKNEKFYIFVFILVLVCVNPPVLTIVNNYAKNNLLTFGFPTLWVWLTFWYFIATIVFLIGCFTLPSWNKEKYKESEIK